MPRGIFITLEGGEGAGKSTQIDRLKLKLESLGHSVLTTREPGGTAGAEAVRHVLLSGGAQMWGTAGEAIMFAAARADNVDNLIRPALERGEIVLCDRFLDSSMVYQGVMGGVPEHILKPLQSIAIEDAIPDLTLVLDIDPRQGLERAAVSWAGDGPDRFEQDDLEQQEERRAGFLAIAQEEPERCVVIDASGSADQVEADIFANVETRLADHQWALQPK